MKIRRATIKDFKDIQRLNHDLFKSDFRFDKTLDLKWPMRKEGKNYYKDAIKKSNYLTLVCEIDDEVVGYLIGSFKGKQNWRKNVKIAELENMLLDSKHRGKRIGTEMIKEFKKWAKEKGANYIKVIGFYGNARAFNFYRKLGFKDYEIILEQKIYKGEKIVKNNGLTCEAGLKKNIISKEVFEREIALCQRLFKENNGKCKWGKCKDCGVIPLLYKLHKGQLLEKPEEIKKAKKN